MSEGSQGSKSTNAAGVGSLVEHIAHATGSLATAVSARDETKVSSLLDNLLVIVTDQASNSLPLDALLLAWSLSGEVLDASLGAEVSAKALGVLASILHNASLCTNRQCNVSFKRHYAYFCLRPHVMSDHRPLNNYLFIGHLQDFVNQLQPLAVINRLTTVMQGDRTNIMLQKSGYDVLASLAGCNNCASLRGEDIRTALVAAGLIQNAISTVRELLSTRSTCDPYSDSQQQLLASAITALYAIAVVPLANLERFAADGGLDLCFELLQHVSNVSLPTVVPRTVMLLAKAAALGSVATPVSLQNAMASVWQVAASGKYTSGYDGSVVIQSMVYLIAAAHRYNVPIDNQLAQGFQIVGDLLEHNSTDRLVVESCISFLVTAIDHVGNDVGSIRAASPALITQVSKAIASCGCVLLQGKLLPMLPVYITAQGAGRGQNPVAAEHLLKALQATSLEISTMSAEAAVSKNGRETPMEMPPHVLSVFMFGFASLSMLVESSAAACLSEWMLETASQMCISIATGCLVFVDADGASAPNTVPWVLFEKMMTWIVSVLLANGSINRTDQMGYALLHRLAAISDSRCLALFLDQAGSQLDVLLRTRHGANALQLAREANNKECEALLLDITQKAADLKQEALLKELEESTTSGDDASRKGKKKKNITRSASFATDQPDEKSQKLQEDAAAEEKKQVLEKKLQRQQQLDDEYEQALAERRNELAEEKRRKEDTVAASASQRMLQSQSTHSMSLFSDEPDSDEMSTISGSNTARDSARQSTPGTMSAHETQAGMSSGGDSVENDAGSGSDEGMQTKSEQEEDAVAAAAEAAIGTTGATNNASPANFSPFTQQQDVSSVFASLQQELQLQASSPINTHQDQGMFASSPSLYHGLSPDALAASLVNRDTGSFSVPHSQFQSPVTGGMLSHQPATVGSVPMVDRSSLHGQSSASFDAATKLAALQDALFVQDGLPSPMAASNMTSAEAALFASLRNSVADKLANMSRKSTPSQHQLVPQSLPSMHSGSPTKNAATSAWLSQYGVGTSVAGSDTTSSIGLVPSSSIAGGDDSGDETSEPTRHLWIGNLGTRTLRSLLKTIFEKFGYVDDVVTFPGRMYAFVNYRDAAEATMAFKALNGKVLAELSGDRPLLLKFRPVKKAAAHLRALTDRVDALDVGLTSIDGSIAGDASVDKDGNCSDPSPRIWLGNIAPTATTKNLQAVLSRFGPLSDAAVFPARIGPLGYAFVKFERLDDAVLAFDTLNNTIVPALSGNKQLKMRYKPATEGPTGRDDLNDTNKGSHPLSRHLWVGNITQKPTDAMVAEIFSRYGRVDSVRIFPAKAYAFVNFTDPDAALKAMAELDGVPVAPLTGVKPLVMRYQQENQSVFLKSDVPDDSGAMSLMNQLVPGSMLPSTMGFNDATRTVPGSYANSTGAFAGASGLSQLNGSTAAALAEQLRQLTSQRDASQSQYLQNQLHRSPSVPNIGFGGNHPTYDAATVAAATAAAAAANASAAQYASLLGGLQRSASAHPLLGLESNGLTDDIMGLQHPSAGFYQAPVNNNPAAYSNTSNPAASNPKYTAVLNSLMELQRANSASQSNMQQLLSLGMMPSQNKPYPQQQHQPDVANLSALLANQSLSSFSHGFDGR